MGSEIPIIDLQKNEELTIKLIKEASEKWGCFRIINHEIPTNLMVEIKSIAIDLFNRTVEIKQRIKEYLPGSGYVPFNSTNDNGYEAFAFDIISDNSIINYCHDLQTSTHQRETIEKYNEFVHKLAIDIASKMVGNTGLQEDYSVEVWPSHFRLNKYTITEDNIGCGALSLHTDASLITILQDDEDIGGLEIVDPSGNFVAVDSVPGSLFVNLGDLAVAWSNGKLRPVQHRVVCKDPGTRVSIATIITPPVDEDIVAHPKFLEGDVSRKYAPFKYADFRKLRASKRLYGRDALELLRSEN